MEEIGLILHGSMAKSALACCSDGTWLHVPSCQNKKPHIGRDMSSIGSPAPRTSAHDALDALAEAIGRKVNWVLDADIRAFYDTISHGWLQRFLEHRSGDRRLLREPHCFDLTQWYVNVASSAGAIVE